MKRISIVSEALRAFIRRVVLMLRKRGIFCKKTILYVLRALRKRGIFPSVTSPSRMVSRASLGNTQEANIQGDSHEKPSVTATAREFVKAHYEVRYNVLDGRPEVRLREGAKGLADSNGGGCSAGFRAVDEQVLNTLVLHLHEEGIYVWNRDVQRIVCSFLPRQYHPLTDWLENLPRWDGTDRVAALARRVSDDGLWHKVFRTWMRAAVRQMWCASGAHTLPHDAAAEGGNQMAPVLISREQGLHKSSFCRMLLPEALRTYFTDKFELAARTSQEVDLARFALINLDEFDRFSAQQMVRLKNLMQLSRMNVRRPHARFFEEMQRTASFIGTSNTTELLTDPSGSRRFFCQEVASAIDCATPLDYAQLYAQLLAEVLAGEPCALTAAERREVEEHNRAYYRSSTLREAFLATFKAGSEEGSAAQWLTATEIFALLSERFPQRVLSGSPSQLGRQLTFVGVKRKHTERGTVYFVERCSTK